MLGHVPKNINLISKGNLVLEFLEEETLAEIGPGSVRNNRTCFMANRPFEWFYSVSQRVIDKDKHPSS